MVRPGAGAAQLSFALPGEVYAAGVHEAGDAKPADARLQEAKEVVSLVDHQLKLAADNAAGGSRQEYIAVPHSVSQYRTVSRHVRCGVSNMDFTL